MYLNDRNLLKFWYWVAQVTHNFHLEPLRVFIGEQKNAIVVNMKRVEFKLVLILEIGLFWNLVRYKHISNNFFQVVKFSFGLSIWCQRISQLFLMNVLPLKTRDFYEFCAYLNGILYIFSHYAQSSHTFCDIDCIGCIWMVNQHKKWAMRSSDYSKWFTQEWRLVYKFKPHSGPIP